MFKPFVGSIIKTDGSVNLPILLQALAKKLEECEKAKADGKNEATELRHQVDQLRDENQRLSSIVQDMRSFGETDSLKAQLKSLGNEKMVLQMQLGECERRAHQKDEVRIIRWVTQPTVL